MSDYRVRRARCLNCKKSTDAAAPVSGARAPEPDDFSVCAYCGHLQVYGVDLKFRELTDEEIVECAGDPEIIKAQEFARMFREWRA